MRARIAIAVVVVACSAHASASAQDRPDFSGRWAVALAAPAAPGSGPARGRGPAGDMGSGWGNNLTITQDATRLTVEYAFFARGDMQRPLRFLYALDGSETKNSVMMGRGVQQQYSKAMWDGNRLVITTQHDFPHPENGQLLKAEVKRVLSLAADSLIVETTRAGVLGGPTSSTRTVYLKATS